MRRARNPLQQLTAIHKSTERQHPSLGYPRENGSDVSLGPVYGTANPGDCSDHGRRLPDPQRDENGHVLVGQTASLENRLLEYRRGTSEESACILDHGDLGFRWESIGHEAERRAREFELLQHFQPSRTRGAFGLV